MYRPFCTSVFESVSACLYCLFVCVCVCLARQWFLSAAQTRDLILPKGPTVDLVTASIFAYFLSSSSTSSSSTSLNLSHALSTSNIQEEENSLTTHTERTYIYSLFICLLPPYAFPTKFPLYPRSLSNSNLLHWHDRGETYVAEVK